MAKNVRSHAMCNGTILVQSVLSVIVWTTKQLYC